MKEAEKQAMIEGIRENGSEAAEFVIRKVTVWRNHFLVIVDNVALYMAKYC